LLGLNRSTLYYEPTPETPENLALMQLIDEEYTRHPFYGSRRLTVWLRERQHAVNRKRVQRLMRLMRLEAIYPKPNLSAGSGHKVYPYLLRGVKVERPDQVWSTEIVYSQMTKPAGLAGRPDGEHVTDLNGVPGHHHPVDQQLDQLSLLRERRRVETCPHPQGERFRGVNRPAHL
jgi:transposase InsO family protein